MISGLYTIPQEPRRVQTTTPQRPVSAAGISQVEVGLKHRNMESL